MSELTISQRYDQFQDDAVEAVTDDFTEKPDGRYLLVVPTGGGKTFVAVKAVSALFAAGTLDPASDRIAWVAHRRELLKQAGKCFDRYTELYKKVSYKAQVDFMMLSEAKKEFSSPTPYRIAVIDEAHHGAAPSYAPMFKSDNLGILGLTATPSRHDGVALDFERESYSIGFPELVELGVLLRPEVVTVEGGVYNDIYDIDDDDSLSVLIDPARQKRIINAILAGRDDYQKIIVYAGTKALTRSLHKSLADSELAEHYDSISYVLGGENSLGTTNEEFFEREKSLERSIVVNVQVLSEGYDDPRINTIVMAAPTNSKLVYMQALGRAIRYDPENLAKRAYVVEVEDKLPNVRYHINNRWLFSDVSDALEPWVEDREFSTPEEFKSTLTKVFDCYNVAKEHRASLDFNPRDRISMLLFKYESPQYGFVYIPIIMNTANRQTALSAFNFLSGRMKTFVYKVDPDEAFKMVETEGLSILATARNRKLIYNAMEAQALVMSGRATPAVAKEYPWISFVSLRWHRMRNQLPDELVEFVADMINGEAILEQILAGDYEPGFCLVKLPLPLVSTVGRIVTRAEFQQIQQVVNQLIEMKFGSAETDHRGEVLQAQSDARWPLETGLIGSTVYIARDDVDYFRELTK